MARKQEEPGVIYWSVQQHGYRNPIHISNEEEREAVKKSLRGLGFILDGDEPPEGLVQHYYGLDGEPS